MEFKVYIYIFLAIAYYAFQYYRKIKAEQSKPVPVTPPIQNRKTEELSDYRENYEPESNDIFERTEQKVEYQSLETGFSFEKTEQEVAKTEIKTTSGRFDEYNQPISRKKIIANIRNPKSLQETLISAEILKPKF